jgi:hypothetical protein
MVDYLDSFALNSAELQVTPLYVRDEELVDDGVDVDSAQTLKKITFEGSVTKTSLALARIYAEAIQGLYDAGEVMFLNCSLGYFFVEFAEIHVRLFEASFIVQVGVKLTGLGSFTYYYPAYEASSLASETNDWNI